MECCFYRQAERIFARIRNCRPFEPQNYILEGMAIAAQGRIWESALRYELVLNRDYPIFNEYVEPVAERLYIDLLKPLIQRYPEGILKQRIQKYLSQLPSHTRPTGLLILFWNIEDTDIDVHITEPGNEHIYYSNRNSSSGGQLFWDNTSGLGPELYEHPTLKNGAYNVFVNYFGSRSVEGVAPSSTLVCTFNYLGNKPPIARWYTTVLLPTQQNLIKIMPDWTRTIK